MLLYHTCWLLCLCSVDLLFVVSPFCWVFNYWLYGTSCIMFVYRCGNNNICIQDCGLHRSAWKKCVAVICQEGSAQSNLFGWKWVFLLTGQRKISPGEIFGLKSTMSRSMAWTTIVCFIIFFRLWVQKMCLAQNIAQSPADGLRGSQRYFFGSDAISRFSYNSLGIT